MRIIGIVILAFLAIAYGKIPSYIQTCKLKDPEISKCINSSIESLRTKLKMGIPELDVPSLEPLRLDVIKLRKGVRSNITDLNVRGVSDFQIENLKANLSSNTFDVKLRIPKMSFVGKYELDIKLLFIPIKGKGILHGNISDYIVDAVMKGVKLVRNHSEYLKFEKIEMKVDMGKFRLRLENLFGGDPVLGEITNQIVNENIQIFLHEIKPNLETALSEKLLNIANRITLRFTYKELFVD